MFLLLVEIGIIIPFLQVSLLVLVLVFTSLIVGAFNCIFVLSSSLIVFILVIHIFIILFLTLFIHIFIIFLLEAFWLLVQRLLFFLIVTFGTEILWVLFRLRFGSLHVLVFPSGF